MASKINWYAKYATEHLVVATDERGLYCEVVSENIEGVSYRVDMDEKTMQAKSCNCKSHKPCKHMRIATEALASTEPKITEIEAGRWYIINSNTQVWVSEDGRWLSAGPTENAVAIVESYLEKRQAVKVAEQIVAEAVTETEEPAETTTEVAESVDETPAQEPVNAAPAKSRYETYEEAMLNAVLNNNRGFSLLRR